MFNLFGGTIENTSTSNGSYAIYSYSESSQTANLYGGKLKSNRYNIFYLLEANAVINIDGTVLESGEGYTHIQATLSYGDTPTSVVDVIPAYSTVAVTVTVPSPVVCIITLPSTVSKYTEFSLFEE